MSHLYHEGLPGYVPDAVLHTGCPECEHRCARGAMALDTMDRGRVQALWRRAAAAYAFGYSLPGEYHEEGRVLLDSLELPLVEMVQAVQRALQREANVVEVDGLRVAMLPTWVV